MWLGLGDSRKTLVRSDRFLDTEKTAYDALVEDVSIDRICLVASGDISLS